MTFLGKFGYIQLTSLSCYNSVSLPYGDWAKRWLEHSVSYLQVMTEGAKNISWPWLSLLQGWGSPNITFLGKVGYIQLIISSCYNSISVPYGDWEKWWFEHSVSYLQVGLSAEGAKNISWPWLTLLQGWGSLTMTFLGRCKYIQLTISSCYSSIPVPYGEWEEWWFEHSVSQMRVALSAKGAKNVSWPWLSPLQGWGSLTRSFLGKFRSTYSSPFHLATIQSQCLMMIAGGGGLSTLYHSCRLACQQGVLKYFLALAISAPMMGQSEYDISW